MNIQVNSEIGHLEGVILHTPGTEIEQMVPDNIHEALYSDLLNLNIASKEYAHFAGVLSKWTQTFQVMDLLAQVLEDAEAREALIQRILDEEQKQYLKEELSTLGNRELAQALIEGYAYRPGVHPAGRSECGFALRPLYNLFFTRDASSSVYDNVLVHKMSTQVRDRESYIMESIFTNIFHAGVMDPRVMSGATTEGGDVLIARDDVLFLGNGCRTNKKGVEYLAEYFAKQGKKQHIIVQELPSQPDSFIHLDMVFTMLAQDKCMAFAPLIMNNNQYHAFHIEIDGGKISYHERSNFLEATKKVGFDFEPILCGGGDERYQHRDQWHSGANFFALGEGKIIGYARNTHTIDALAKAGFDVLSAEAVCQGREVMQDHDRFVVTFEASELPRGGGGARCMTMPVRRKPVIW